MIPVIDAHLDLAWNALSFDRDQTLPVHELNARERHMTDAPFRGAATVSLPEMRKAHVAVCVATLLARAGPDQSRKPSYRRFDLDFAAPSIAHAHAQGQRAYYALLESRGHIRILRTAAELRAHWDSWRSAFGAAPLGIILSMEGCDPITHPDEAPAWWELGLRAAGITHYGNGQYGSGTGTEGGLTQRGVALLREFDRLGMALDVTHLADRGLDQALEIFRGPVLASHHNCRALVPGQRQLTDDQIRRLIARDAVIGTSMDAWMLYPLWQRGKTSRSVIGLDAAADHIDHICQLAGSVRHSAIGSDLDGGFGSNQTPRDLDTIADIQRLAGILKRRGYAPSDIAAIFHGNWIRFFSAALSTT